MRFCHKVFGVGLALSAAALLPGSASAQAFDFETTPSGFYSSLVLTMGGQTLTLSPEFLGGFIDIQGSGVPLMGSHSAIGSQTGVLQSGQFVPMRFSFSHPVSSITFAFGDAGGDDDSPARIQAFDAFNNSLGVFDTPYPANKADGATDALTFSGPGADYFIVSSFGTSNNDNSIFWEVTASDQAPLTSTTPEPASIALMATGLFGVTVAARRRKKNAIVE